MEVWQTILLAFGGNAALLAVLAYSAKSLLDNRVVRDTKLFESELRSKADLEIERLKSDMSNRIESYKVQLKKSEIFFEKELEAASALSTLFHGLLPRYGNPVMEWEDACTEMANDFASIEVRLTDFMTKHAAMLNETERELLVGARADAGYGKFGDHDGTGFDEVEQAEKMYAKLKELERILLERVRAQARL